MRQFLHGRLSVACLLLLSMGRPAWEWSDDERLARRFDPGASHVDGRRNPELFFPHELFAQLVMTALIDDTRAETRERLASVIEGDAATFWSRLEAASAPYAAILTRERALAAQLSSATEDKRVALQQEIVAVQTPQCAARIDALNAAVQAIGKPALYRVLYKAIAPEMSVTAGPELTAERMRFIAGGCR
jgi:hypothetical protein